MSKVAFEQDDAEDQILAQALYVDQEDLGAEEDQEQVPPSTGEEYLKQVVRQAKKLDFVTTGMESFNGLGGQTASDRGQK